MTDILDMVEGEEYFNPEDLDEREVLGDDEENITKNIKKEDTDGDDLYDAAIEPSGINEKRELTDNNILTQVKKEISNNFLQAPNPTNTVGKRYCCYVGNMTWWTTDNDLQSAILCCGVSPNELVDLKFHENRNNGQSKGFALAVFSTETAVRAVTEKLPVKRIYDQNIVVLPYNKQSLAKLEDATKRVEPKDKKDDKSGMLNIGTIRIGPVGVVTPIGMGMSLATGGTIRSNVPPPTGSQPPPTSIMSFQNQSTSLAGAPPPQFQMRSGATGTPVVPTVITNVPPPVIQQRPPIDLSGPPPTTNVPPPTVNVLNRPPPNFSTQQSITGVIMNTSAPPPHQNANLVPNQITSGSGLRTAVPPPGMHNSLPPSSGLPPGAHINPQVYPSFAQSFGNNNSAIHSENVAGGLSNSISEAEFEEIMNRNRTVSSSAINRAVSDATAGDYPSAIETLVTAISLIRQSRVANDDRCKVLIAALQDTLQGIEGKSYNSSSRKHRSGRDRSRSPDRSQRKRHRRSSRSRSRSRDRYDYSPRHSTRRY